MVYLSAAASGDVAPVALSTGEGGCLLAGFGGLGGCHGGSRPAHAAHGVDAVHAVGGSCLDGVERKAGGGGAGQVLPLLLNDVAAGAGQGLPLQLSVLSEGELLGSRELACQGSGIPGVRSAEHAAAGVELRFLVGEHGLVVVGARR